MRLTSSTYVLVSLLFSFWPTHSYSQGTTGSRTGFLIAESMKCDGRSDDTAAFNALTSAAVSDKGPSQAPVELLTIQLPPGKCRLATAPNPITAGIRILGNGNRNGTWLIADYNEPKPDNGFLTWNGSFSSAGGGGGGGLQHLHISKGSGKTGGTAIKIEGIDGAHRSAFMTFDDLYINSAFGASGYWDHNLIADGSCCTTKSSNGVRDIILTNFHFGQSQPQVEGESILVRNVVHMYISNGLIFTAQHGGIHVTGIDAADEHSSHDILISNVNIEGSLILDNVEGATFDGWLAGRLATAATARKCYISGVIEGSIQNAGQCALSTDQQFLVPQELMSRSDDLAGSIKLQNGSAVYKFTHAFMKPPVCTASDEDSPSPVRIQISPTELILTGHNSDKIDYICIGKQ
jgi:hypothetical protein